MQKMPWDVEPPKLEPLEDRFQRLKSDVATMVTYTCIVAVSNHTALDDLKMNIQRGTEVPSGVASYAARYEVRFKDIGMPQPGVRFGSIAELIALVHDTATREGLGL